MKLEQAGILLVSVWFGIARAFLVPFALPNSKAGRARATGTAFTMSAAEFTKPFVASIDEGTQSCRFMVFDKKGKLVAVHQEEKKQYYPQPGWYAQTACWA